MIASRAPEITVVVPTHNRRESLLRLLTGLTEGSFPGDRFEVVVVADGCVDDTVTAVASARVSFRLSAIEQSPGKGPATARNRGAAAATAPLILFLDDDIEPLPTMLEEHVRLHAASGPSGNTIVVGAPIPIRRPDADFQEIAMWGWWEQQFEAMRDPGHRFSYGEIFGGVLSIPRNLFSKAGGFDEGFNECREDPELGSRLLRLGAEVTFSREAGGRHHELRDRAQLLARKQAEGRADLLLARVHPELWSTVRASQAPGGSLGLRLLRRLAFERPALGDVLLRSSGVVLDWLERLRWRGRWRALHGATMYYSYWRGVVSELGGAAGARSTLTELGRAAEAAAAARSPREIEIDLATGVAAAEARLDELRPDAVRVTFGDIVLGVIPWVPGAEALSGRHLRRQVANWLEGPLGSALALRAVDSGRGRPSPVLELVSRS